MGDKTKIQWADATWNPVVGCTKVSEGCRNCYAFDLHNMRYKAKLEGKQLPEQYAKPFSEIQLFPERLEQPLRWKRPRRIFVNSLSDLFHQEVPFEFIRAVWATMALAYQHTFQVLTKRPERALEFFGWMRGQEWRVEESLPNVWFGVTVENQQAADERIPLLLQTTAAVRWLSCEPLLGAIDLHHIQVNSSTAIDSLRGIRHVVEYKEHKFPHTMINWVVVGGESGSKARPMHPEWARSLRDQCQAAGVPFFFKQWGEWAPYVRDDKYTYGDTEKDKYTQAYVNPDGSTGCCWIVDGDGTWQNWTGEPHEKCAVVNRVGKQGAGRLLDGVLWDKYPKEV